MCTSETRLTPSDGCQLGCPDTVFKLHHDGEVAVNKENGAKREARSREECSGQEKEHEQMPEARDSVSQWLALVSVDGAVR